MKHEIYKYWLRALRHLALLVQVGNPAGRAPAMVASPGEAERIYGLEGASEGVFVWRLRKVLCSGLYGGVVIDGRNRAYSRFITYPWGKELHPGLSSPYLGKVVATLEKAVFLITPVVKGNYYHWVADLLPRLMLARRCGLEDLEDRWVILHDSPRKYESDTLRLLGVREDRMVRLKAFEFVCVQDLVIADLVQSQDRQSFPFWKKQLLEDFLGKIKIKKKKTSRRVYLLRGPQRTRRLMGEERLVELLRAKGFEIVDPQQLTLEEQIKTLAGAGVVVGLHGAALTNIVFCREGTLVVEIRSMHMPPRHFYEIARTFNLRFETVTVPPEKSFRKGNDANKQNLILTKESITDLCAILQPFYS